MSTRLHRCLPLALAAALLLALAAVPASAQVVANERVCVFGFSKDFGAVRLNSGSWNQLSCTTPGVGGCRTLTGRDASMGGFFFFDNAQCVNNAFCDEAPDLDGRFEASVDLNVRLQDPCPVRGDLRGTFRLLDAATQTIVLASGDIDGTLGVGTHREDNPSDCERCGVANYDPQFQRWYFDSEGFIDGKVIAGQYSGCELRVSYAGEFNANGDPSGPLPPSYNWGFEGKADGVLICPCQ